MVGNFYNEYNKLNILFIGYWPFWDGLTQSTIIPHLNLLASFDAVDQVVFTSIERNNTCTSQELDHKKLIHIPLQSKKIKPLLLNKWFDFYKFPRELIKISEKYQVNYTIARGSPAGSLAYKLWRKTKIPFYVESFEPHADYMKDSKVWSKIDPRYIMQKIWESRQKKYASGLFPVSYNYRNKLLREGIPEETVKVLSCEVDLNLFKIPSGEKNEIRNKLDFNIENIVGVYVGKFGDIYWDEEALELFKKGIEFFHGRLHILVLSPQPQSEIESKFKSRGIQSDRFTILKAPFEKVPDYLNAADFAFSLIKSTPNRKFCSPIKNGEYWACGLPVLIPDGIGDDSQILKETGLGVVMEDMDHPEKYFLQLEQLIKANRREEIRELAIKYRNPKRTKEVYQKLIRDLTKDERK